MEIHIPEKDKVLFAKVMLYGNKQNIFELGYLMGQEKELRDLKEMLEPTKGLNQ